MATPLDLIVRLARPTRLAPAIGCCAVCREPVRAAGEAMRIRGGLHVHRSCATYRMRRHQRHP
jgi:hypothetical protein